MSKQSIKACMVCLVAVAMCSLGSSANAQQAFVNPGVQPPQQQLGVYTKFISLGHSVFVPNKGLPQGQGGGGGGGQPAVMWEPWNGRCSSGCEITSVSFGSVAAKSGLEIGDIVLTLDGRRMQHQNSLQQAVQYCQGKNVLCWVVNVRTRQLTKVWCNFGGGGSGWDPSPQPVPASPQFGNR